MFGTVNGECSRYLVARWDTEKVYISSVLYHKQRTAVYVPRVKIAPVGDLSIWNACAIYNMYMDTCTRKRSVPKQPSQAEVLNGILLLSGVYMYVYLVLRGRVLFPALKEKKRGKTDAIRKRVQVSRWIHR